MELCTLQTVTSQALGYPTHRSGLMVPDARCFWTEASACVLRHPSVTVQVFWVICRYMHSPRTVGKSQSQRYHRNSLPGMHKLRKGRIESWTASGVRKTSKGTGDLHKLNMSRRVTMDRSQYTNWWNIHAFQVLYMCNGSQGLNKRNKHRMRKTCGAVVVGRRGRTHGANHIVT